VSGSHLARYHDLIDEPNDLVPLLLGALKLFDEFAVAVGDRTDAVPASATAGNSRDEPLLQAALGLLSLRRTARRWAAEAACGNLSASRETPAAVSRSTQLLR
jgi:hypothetical protein